MARWASPGPGVEDTRRPLVDAATSARAQSFSHVAVFLAWRLADAEPLALRLVLGLSAGDELLAQPDPVVGPAAARLRAAAHPAALGPPSAVTGGCSSALPRRVAMPRCNAFIAPASAWSSPICGARRGGRSGRSGSADTADRGSVAAPRGAHYAAGPPSARVVSCPHCPCASSRRPTATAYTRSRASTSTSSPETSSRCSARTAPARPPRSASSPRS